MGVVLEWQRYLQPLRSQRPVVHPGCLCFGDPEAPTRYSRSAFPEGSVSTSHSRPGSHFSNSVQTKSPFAWPAGDPAEPEALPTPQASSECPRLPVTAGVFARRGSLFEERLPLSRSTGILAHSCSLSLHHQPGSAPLSPQLTPRNQAPEEVCGLSGLLLLPWRNTALYHPPGHLCPPVLCLPVLPRDPWGPVLSAVREEL